MPIVTLALSQINEKYELREILGSGSFGVVRRCVHRETGEHLAVKTIAKAKVSDIEVLKREIDILRTVHHPNIIRLVDVYEDFDNIHLVTELCTGGELYDRVLRKSESEEGHFTEADAATLICDVLDAIAYCHSKSIVHRDLKPENFLLSSDADDAQIKIIDFGLSRYADPTFGVMESRVGTPYYVAPEVLQRNYTSKCDVWSIGVIAYILLCGFAPFAGDNDYETMYQIEHHALEFPAPEWDDISDSAKDFITFLLQKDPKKRPCAKKALEHPWIVGLVANPIKASLMETVVETKAPLEEESVSSMQVETENEWPPANTSAPPINRPPQALVDEETRPPPIPPRDSLNREESALLKLDGEKTNAFRKFLQNVKIRKGLRNLTTGLSTAEVKALGTIFGRVDRDKDGRIALADIDKAVAVDPKFSGSLREKLVELRQKLPMRRNERLDVSALIDAVPQQSHRDSKSKHSRHKSGS